MSDFLLCSRTLDIADADDSIYDPLIQVASEANKELPMSDEIDAKDIAASLVLLKRKHNLSVNCVNDIIDLLKSLRVLNIQMRKDHHVAIVRQISFKVFSSTSQIFIFFEIVNALQWVIFMMVLFFNLFVVNELPSSVRFSIENIILAGIWPDPSKPSRDQIRLIYRPLIDELLFLNMAMHSLYLRIISRYSKFI